MEKQSRVLPQGNFGDSTFLQVTINAFQWRLEAAKVVIPATEDSTLEALVKDVIIPPLVEYKL
jgi:hypothetical protein